MAETDLLRQEAVRIAEKIAKLRRSDTLIVPIYTDLHTPSADSDSVCRLRDALEILGSALPLDAVISLGDNLAMLGREHHIANDAVRGVLGDVFEHVSDGLHGNVPLLAINGNHDGLGTDFFMQDLWYSVVGGKYDLGLARRNGKSSYYYVDFDRSRTRVIFLSVPSGSDIDAEYPIPMWEFGKDQLRWLSDTALDVPGGYENVLLVCHVPFYYYSEYNDKPEAMIRVWTGSRACETQMWAVCGKIQDRAEAEALLHDYQNRKKCRIRACLSGHIHTDTITLPGGIAVGGQNKLPCPQITTASADSTRTRNVVKGSTDFGMAIDVMVYTPSENKMTLLRFGDGEDREIPLS